MLTKCFNPSCSASFRFLHSGRLFHFEKRLPFTTKTASARMSSSGEFFWLCEKCAAELTLVQDPKRGVRTVPLVPQTLPQSLPGEGIAAAV